VAAAALSPLTVGSIDLSAAAYMYVYVSALFIGSLYESVVKNKRMEVFYDRLYVCFYTACSTWTV